MTQQLAIVDIQFGTDPARNQEALRRLVEQVRQSQQAINSLIRENAELSSRVAALEAAAP